MGKNFENLIGHLKKSIDKGQKKEKNMSPIDRATKDAKENPDAPPMIVSIQGHRQVYKFGSMLDASPQDIRKRREWEKEQEKKQFEKGVGAIKKTIQKVHDGQKEQMKEEKKDEQEHKE